ncbi:hypothetical protein ABBQ38_014756 [Trebouxia sp. C0009 RCD-2024]
MAQAWLDALKAWLPASVLPGQENLVVIKSSKDIEPKLVTGSTPPKHQILITTYDLVQKIRGHEKHFRTIICDESHFFKSHTSKKTKFIWPLVHAAKRAILITNTPTPSRPIELSPEEMKDIDAVMRHMKDLLVLSHKAKTAAELVLMHLFDASRNTKIEAAVQQIKAALTTGGGLTQQ